MKEIDANSFIKSLEVDIPSYDQFSELGDLTSLHVDTQGQFHRLNYERGMILYAIIAKYKPKAVLEFGTGRGYGCLCMAWAMHNFDILGKIFTIDSQPQNKKIKGL